MPLINDRLGLVKQTSTYPSFAINTAKKRHESHSQTKTDELEKIYVKKTARNIKDQELKNARVGFNSRED